MIHFGGIEIAHQLAWRLLARARSGYKRLLQEPILVTGIFPTGEVHNVKAFTLLAEAPDNSGVGDAVLDHEIDFVADGFGEMGNFSVMPPSRE